MNGPMVHAVIFQFTALLQTSQHIFFLLFFANWNGSNVEYNNISVKKKQYQTFKILNFYEPFKM